MPFDPRLITPDDAPLDAHGEIDLPDDLAELAAQLRDDAAHLSACYPAPALHKTVAAAEVVSAPSRTINRTSRMRRALLASFAVAAALAVAVGIGYLPRQEDEVARARPLIATEVAATSAPDATSETSSTAPAASPSPRIQRLPWAPTPAIGEVSGPELEGLLDLWQNDEQVTETRISI